MNFKTLLLGSAAALLMAGGAQAADLAAEPVDYVKVCDAFGAGYYYAPGTDTCIKIGGYVRFEILFNEDDQSAWDYRNYDFRTKAHIDFTAKSMTEYGPLVAFIALEAYDYDSYYSNGPGNYGDYTYVDEAYLGLGPFMAGYTWSAWATPAQWGGQIDVFSGFSGWNKTNLMAFNWAVNGLGLTIELDDPAYRGAGYGDMPDIVAILSGKWDNVSARLGFGYGDRGAYDSIWGVRADLNIGLDNLAKGDYLKLWAIYSANGSDWIAAYGPLYSGDVGWDGESFYAVAGQFKHVWSAQFATLIGAAWRDASVSGFERTKLTFDAVYTPVKNFSITGELAYLDTPSTDGNLSGTIRIQRSFP